MVSETPVAERVEEELIITADHLSGSQGNWQAGRPGRASCLKPFSPQHIPCPAAGRPQEDFSHCPLKADPHSRRQEAKFLFPTCSGGDISVGWSLPTRPECPLPSPAPLAFTSSLLPLELIPRQTTYPSA